MEIQLSELVALLSQQSNSSTVTPFEIGKSYFIRTVTYHAVGQVNLITGHFIVMRDASWVADSGRFHQALQTGELSDVEVFPNSVILNLDSIVDATEWTHPLPVESI